MHAIADIAASANARADGTQSEKSAAVRQSVNEVRWIMMNRKTGQGACRLKNVSRHRDCFTSRGRSWGIRKAEVAVKLLSRIPQSATASLRSEFEVGCCGDYEKRALRRDRLRRARELSDANYWRCGKFRDE